MNNWDKDSWIYDNSECENSQDYDNDKYNNTWDYDDDIFFHKNIYIDEAVSRLFRHNDI